jgi:hypothetical protein
MQPAGGHEYGSCKAMLLEHWQRLIDEIGVAVVERQDD